MSITLAQGSDSRSGSCPPTGRGMPRSKSNLFREWFHLSKKHFLLLTILEYACQHDIDWEQARIINKEQNWTQRKLLEGIETLRQKNNGKIPLNQYNQMDQWSGLLHSLFNLQQWRQITSDVRCEWEHCINNSSRVISSFWRIHIDRANHAFTQTLWGAFTTTMSPKEEQSSITNNYPIKSLS